MDIPVTTAADANFEIELHDAKLVWNVSTRALLAGSRAVGRSL